MFKKEEGYDEYLVEQVNRAIDEVKQGKLIPIDECFSNAEKALYEALAEVQDVAVYG